MEKGKLIVIEGACDGIGKTTQYNLLEKRLTESGESIINHHFPSYETYQGKGVEEYLNGKYGPPNELSPYFINNLFANDRCITWYLKLKKQYEEGKIILLDRYTTSSLIYQGAFIDNIEERKKFIDYIVDYEYNKLRLKEPDITIFLEAPFDLVTELRNKRKNNSGISNDIHERNIEIMKKAYENALFVADYLSFNRIQCNNGKTMRSANDIHEEIYSLIKRKK